MLSSLALLLSWLLVFRLAQHQVWQLALVSLPGTLAHELMHLIVGVLLRARPTAFSVWPTRRGDYLQLGSVTFTRITLWNGAWVAFAPFLLAPLAWLIYAYWMIPAWAHADFVSWVVAGYCCACFCFACIPSVADLKAGFSSLVLYGLAGTLLWPLVR